MWSNRRVIFCLTGSNFSGKFLDCWTTLVSYCLQNKIEIVVNRRESCNIYYVRNMCLGADVSRGENQKPFDGKIDYTHLMWIDSDILFSPREFQKLLDDDKDIVSGIYMMDNGQQFATVKEWDEEYFKKNGGFQFLTPEDIKRADESATKNGANKLATTELLEVAYTGFGFMMIKKGVFESMTYPWFRPIEKKIGDMVDFTMEDVAFCLRAKEAGFKVHIDPLVRVGHEKKIVL
ncbi:MAG: hypothetical protein A2297_04700 [Elusimicrobia bacterium RIFOXYB2_FULL_48_7]|nr:MAG: hypothetical protein A2297_04700 [Elusimicrobia bacterium RIFOXYB2_FULL_48_7]